MADIQANIGIGVDTTQALAAIRQLQREISVFHTLMAKGGADAAAKSLQMQQGLINTINETGKFSASMTRVSSSTESFTNALEKNKLSMGQYFRYAGGASKSFGKMFTKEFNTINRVATERVKDLQTQYISMGRDANGALQAIKVRPLALDMNNLGTKVMFAAQKQQIFNQLLKQGTTNLLNFGKNTQWAGRQLMVGFTIPLTIFGATAAREFQKLEEQAVKFRRVYGDMFTTDADTEKALKNVRELADEFTKYGIAVEKTVGLAAKVAQMGNVGSDLTAQVTQATRLAVLGGLEQEEALDTTISLTNAFGVAAEDLAGKIAFLNAAENQTILAIEDFNEAIPKAGSVVQQLGGDVEDLAFMLTAMREGGINASQAANAIKSSLGRMINPTAAATEKLRGFGIDIMGIVESNVGNLNGTIMQLGYALDELDPLNRARAIETLFGKFQFARMSTMFSNIVKEGSQANRVLQLTTNSTEELAIIAERELKRVEESPAFKLQKQMEQLRASLAPIGEEFIKAVGPIIEFGTKLLKSFNNLGDGGKQFIVILTAVAGVVAPALLMGFGLIANGVANLIKFFLFLGNAFGRLSGQSTLLGGQTEYMTQQQLEAAAVAASLGQSHSNLTQIFTSEASAVAGLVSQYRAAITAQRQLSIGQTAAGVAARSGIKPQGFATGGIIRGPGTGTSDSIFAMLSNGEAVIPAAVVKENPEAIKQLIAGNIPGYSDGTPEVPQVNMLNRTISSSGDEKDQAAMARLARRLNAIAKMIPGVLDNFANTLENGMSISTETLKNRIKASLSQENKEIVELLQYTAVGGGGPAQSGMIKSHGGGEGRKASAEEARRLGLPENSTLHNDLVFGETAAANANKLSGEERAEWFKSNQAETSAYLQEQGYLDLSDEQQAEDYDVFSQSVAKELADAGDRAITESEFQEIVARGIAKMADGAAKKGMEEAQKTYTTYTGANPNNPKKRTSLPAGTGLVADENNVLQRVTGLVRPDGSKRKGWQATELTEEIKQETNAKSDDYVLDVVKQRARGQGLEPNIPRADPQLVAQANEDGDGYVENLKNAVAEGAPNVVPTLLNAGGWSSPHPTWVAQGAEDGEGYQQAFDSAASGTGKPPLPGNLAAPQPPAMPEPPKQGRFGKLFSGVKDKINDSKIAQKAADYLSGGDLNDKITVTPAMSDEEREAHRTAKAINQDLYDKGLITEDMQATPLGETQGVTPVRVVDGKIDIGKNSVDDLANASPAAEQAAESDKFTRAVKDNRAAQEEVAEATENLADSTDQKAKDDKAARKEEKRQNRQARAGKALAGLGTLTMAAGMATQVPGVVGETAQKLVGPLALLSGIAPLLMALPAPLAALIAVVGAGVWALMSFNKMIKEARQRAYDLTTALGTGEKAMNTFAEFAGTVGSQEILAKRIENIGRPMQKVAGQTTFGDAFLGSDPGAEYVKNIENAISSVGSGQAANMLYTQLASAISSNILSIQQARSIAASIGDAVGDYGISLNVQSKLLSLMGPNGEDLLKDPLKLNTVLTEIVTDSANNATEVVMSAIEPLLPSSNEVIERYAKERAESRGFVDEVFTRRDITTFLESAGLSRESIIEQGEGGRFSAKTLTEQEVARIQEATGVNPLDLQEAFINGSSELAKSVFADIYAANARSGIENNNLDPGTQAALASTAFVMNAEKAGESLASIENYFATAQGALATTILTAEEALDAAIESGDPQRIREAREERNQAIGEFRNTLQATSAQVKASMLDTDTFSLQNRRDAFADQNVRITADLEGDNKRNMENLLTLLGETTDDKEYYSNFIVRGMLEDGDIQQGTLGKLFNALDAGGDALLVGLVAELSLDVGEDYSAKFAELLTTIKNPEIVSRIMFDVDNTIRTPAQTIDYINSLGNLISLGTIFGEDNTDWFQENVISDPIAAARYTSNRGRVIGLQGDYSPDALKDEFGEALGSELTTAINVDRAKFDEFEEDTKQDFVTDLIVSLGVKDETGIWNFIKTQFAGTEIAGANEVVDFGTDEQLEAIGQNLYNYQAGKVEVPPPGTEPNPTPTGSGAEPQIDSMIKKLRDLRLATVDMKKGWEGMQEVLENLFAGGTKSIDVFDGLSNQIRKFDVGENLIEMIVGMDPDEYEKRKNELFTFDKAGNITGITAKLKNMNAALGAIALGEYVNTQQAFIENTRNQITAISTLTANGLSLSEAYQVVQDEAVAAKIAMGATTEEIRELVRITQIANGLREDLEEQNERSQISEAVRKTNEEFENRVAVLDRLSKSAGQYTDAQITALLDDTNLQKLMLDPSIDQGALNQALRNAERNAEIELKVKLATTEGTKGVFEEGFAQAMDAFSRQEQEIELNFRAANADDTALVEDAQNRIADIQYQLDDYNAELERISWQEESINDKYDQRFEALESIAEVNERISREQEAQLDIADALSRGDIAGAARAQQELRSKQAQDAAKQQRDMLEQARDAEIAALTSGGMTREQLEDRIQGLERQIFAIEESDLEPAQERLRLQEIIKQDQIESLVVLEKTRDEWDRIKNNIDIAEASGYKFKETMQQALDVVEKLMEAYPEIKPAPPPPPPAPAPSSGGGGGPELGQPGKGNWTMDGKKLSDVARDAGFGSWQAYYNANRGSMNLDAQLRPNASGGLVKMAMGGKVRRYAGGGMIIPKRMAMGGMSMGSDIIPAILTPGEFVVRRPAVSAFGADNLEKINRGTYSDGTVYNYNLAVNVKSDSDPNRIARAVMTQIKGIENQRIRSNRL